MSRFEGATDLINNLKTFLPFGPPALSDHMPQRVTGEKLHHKITRTLKFTHIMNDDHIRMDKTGRRPCLTIEPFDMLRSVHGFGRKDFDRDIAFERFVVSPIDGAHRPSTDEFPYLKVFNLLPD